MIANNTLSSISTRYLKDFRNSGTYGKIATEEWSIEVEGRKQYIQSGLNLVIRCPPLNSTFGGSSAKRKI